MTRKGDLMRRIAALAVVISIAFPLLAQNTTATLSGRATTTGVPLAGILVTISSPALQGTRSAETSAEGTYSFVSVPPGEYRVTFALSGMQTVTRSTVLHVADLTRVDADLQPGMSEEITVVPEMVRVLDTIQLASTFEQDLVNALPMGRGIIDIARLAAGAHDSGPSRQLSFHGAPSNENLYMVNGAVITEGLRNQPHNLFIEDAIQETTILTGAVSAEYGRFTGGVVNVITRSGGNELTGSVRDNISNDDWISKTPIASELDHLDEVNHDYEATLGGRIVRDRLWFFVAGRSAQRTESRQTAATNHAYTNKRDESRLELKATASVMSNQTFIASFLDVDAEERNASASPVADLNSLFVTDQPHSLFAAHYSAILPRSIVLEAQYTQKSFDLSGGGTDRSRLAGTVISDLESDLVYGSPMLCGVCEPSYRDNRELALKGTMFHATPRFGSHSIVVGASDFRESGSNSFQQSPSDFTVYTFTDVIDGTAYPMMIPGASEIVWEPIFAPSVGNAFTTRSAYVNDRVDFGSHWNFSVGVRYDRSTGHDQAGDEQAEGSAWSPRLGVVYDLGGDRRNQFSLSFGRYAAKIDQFVGDQASPGGDPSFFDWIYDGPQINTAGEQIPADQVLRAVFDWFDSVGGTSNTDLLLDASSPISRVIEDRLRAPVMDEVTFGYGRQLGPHGALRVDLIQRRWHDFYALRATRDTGTIDDPLSGLVFDRIVLENNDAGLHRRYNAAALQGSWRAGAFQIGGNYTYSRLRGNVESDSAASGAVALQSPVHFYPEYTSYPGFADDGWLSADERHRGNLWAAWRFPNRVVDVEASVLQTYHSGRRYSAVGSIDVRPFVTNPGYRNPPNIQNYTFGERGEFQRDAITATNLGINLSRRIATVEAFLETDILNIFNEQGIESPSINTTVRTNRTDRNLATFNPFTQTSVECPQGVSSASAQCKGITHYQLAPQFGTPTSKDAYQLPRTYRLSVGVRF
jgi:TonB dependent receptor/Carboxypeptidase regulatory-like domain/TonB-dependent Receptor Plug Domain